jgi:hypothetical protein
MGILFPPPGPPEPSWQRLCKQRFLGFCSFLVPRLEDWNHVMHAVGVCSLFFLVVGVLWTGPWEALHTGVEIAVATVFVTYLLLSVILFIAKRADFSTVLILNEWDREVDLALENATHSGTGVFSEVRFVRSEDDLNDVVRLTHDSLGIQHEDRGFSREARKELYSNWVKANPSSIMLLVPNYGRASGETVGISIILPLRAGMVSEIWNGCGVLKLDKKHILPSNSKSVQFVLIDTLLLREDLVHDYLHLAVRACHLHLAMFYSKRNWPRTTFYSVTLKPKICELLEKRGFQPKGKSVEGESLFQFVVQQANTLTSHQYDDYAQVKNLVEVYSKQLQEMAKIPGSANP